MSRSLVWQRYCSLWGTAYDLLQLARPEVQVGMIEERVLLETDLWAVHPERRVGWNWRIVMKQEQKTLKRFEAAFWVGDVLCGLMVCRVSKRRVNLAVRFIEGAPHEHPLQKQLMKVAIMQAEIFAGVIGATSVAIIKPVHEIVHLYQGLGYEMEYADRVKVERSLAPRLDQLIKKLS